MTQTLWGDVASGRLVRVECTYNGPPKTEVVMSNFEFGVPLDESLFATAPPEGYKATSIPINATRPTELDFIKAMRQFSDAADGDFPVNLDMPGIAAATAKLLKSTDPKEKMAVGARASRGLSFPSMLPLGSDPYYAGKGHKRQGPKVPVLWYKPNGSQKYRIIWSDLTATDADVAPNVPDAVRMIKIMKNP